MDPNLSKIGKPSPGCPAATSTPIAPIPDRLFTPPYVKCGRSHDFYKKIVNSYIERHDYDTALFWADKLVSLSNNGQEEIYLLAHCMYCCKQYQRSAFLLEKHNLERTNLFFRHLAGLNLYHAKEFHKALDILDIQNNNIFPGQKIAESKWEPNEPHKCIYSQICLLRGKIYEALMNSIMAIQNYKMALKHDVYCFEAFHLLTQHQMLSKEEETNMIDSITNKMCHNGDYEFIKYVYSTKIKKYTSCSEETSPTVFAPLKKNLDILTSDAEKAFYDCDFQAAYQVSIQIIKEDPYHVGALPVYVACLLELKKNSELFKVSHKLVQVMPESALTWYSVASYYYMIGKQESARRNLNKSLLIDPLFGPSWLLFGHSFAIENEHDQAMAAYFKATQLMKGCHLPMLHVGLECGLSNNPQLAMKFLQDAKEIAPRDPFIKHEMGVVRFNEKKYDEACKLFLETAEMIEQSNTSGKTGLKKWEPLYNNLGHCLRKLERFDEAYIYHQKALVLCPSNASTYAAIGLVHAVSGKTEPAIEAFHNALSLRRDDAFSNTMLRYVIEKMVEDATEDLSIIADEENEENTDEEMILYKNPEAPSRFVTTPESSTTSSASPNKYLQRI